MNRTRKGLNTHCPAGGAKDEQACGSADCVVTTLISQPSGCACLAPMTCTTPLTNDLCPHPFISEPSSEDCERYQTRGVRHFTKHPPDALLSVLIFLPVGFHFSNLRLGLQLLGRLDFKSLDLATRYAFSVPSSLFHKCSTPKYFI